MPSPFLLLVAFAVAALAGAVNAIAGGGTLLTFPSLLALGLDSKVANGTSTLGLWPGSLGAAWGYRREIAHGGKNLLLFFVPSLVGGVVGALLFLYTRADAFDALVPWLILLATLLFMAQGPLSRWLRSRSTVKGPVGAAVPYRWPLVIPLQFLVAVYGGYFGAGIGILMLATLGLLGLEDIHQMNGIKSIAALFINGVAAVLFAWSGIVDWPIALVMAAGATIGGYLSAGLARWLGPRPVRVAVIGIGLLSAAWTALRPIL